MEDISPSPVESGFLTAPHSGRPTPSTTQGTLYTSDEQLNDNYEIQEKLPRNRLHSLSVNNLDEVRLSDRQQSSFSQNSSSPNISESFRRRNEPISSEINMAETEREAPQEQQLLPQNPGETPDNVSDRHADNWLCKSVTVRLWIIVCCFVSVILAVLLGCLLPRCAVKDLSSCGPPCNESWIWVGGRCYFFSDDSNTWNDSREFCTRHGSTLAMLIDQNITKTIERYRGKWNYWIGLSINHNGQWMWINGSPFNGSSRTTYTGRPPVLEAEAKHGKKCGEWEQQSPEMRLPELSPGGARLLYTATMDLCEGLLYGWEQIQGV